MKKKLLMCSTILFIGCSVAFGHISPDLPPKNVVNLKPVTVVDAFIEAQVNTNAALLNQVMRDDSFINVCNGKKALKHTKSTMLKFYKKQGPLRMNCESSYEVLSASNSVVVTRVDFKFPFFVQKNFLTLEKDEDGNWQITEISQFHENC